MSESCESARTILLDKYCSFKSAVVAEGVDIDLLVIGKSDKEVSTRLIYSSRQVDGFDG